MRLPLTRGCARRRRAAWLLWQAAALIAAPPLRAQDSGTDPELEALIPDEALSEPQAWAIDTETARSAPPEAADPAAPALADFAPAAPGVDDPARVALPWSDADAPLPPIAPLAPDPALRAALAEERPAPAAALALPEMSTGSGERFADLVESRLSRRITLAYPPEFGAFPQIGAFESRFEALSSLRNLAGEEDNLAQLARRARADRTLLVGLLEAFGFYDGDVIQIVTGDRADPAAAITPREARFRFLIDPGPRYRFGTVDLGGLARTGADYPALRGAFGLAPGDPIEVERIASERLALAEALGEGGYPFAEIGAPDLLIDHARDEGDLTVPITPGGKYVFGAVTSDRPRFLGGEHLADIARFAPGDPYRTSDVEDLRRAIIATGLVSTVTVTPRAVAPPDGAAPGEVALDVAMVPASPRTVAGSLGYGSEEGARVELSWEHRNLFPPEGLLRVRGIAGTQEQLLGVTLRRNNFRARDEVLSLDLFANTSDRDAYEARTVSAVAKYERLSTLIFQKELSWSLGLELVATQEREGALDGSTGPRDTYLVAAVPGHVLLDESDSLIDPTRGYRASLRVSPEVSRQGGGQHVYLRAQFDASYYRPFGDRVVLAARGRLGTIVGAQLPAVAPSRRLYAGGGGSVRGYGYQQIGPENTLGDPTGGRSLTEFSLEARVRTGLFGGVVSLVPFIDAGAIDPTSTPRWRELQFGAGLGLRYDTSFGPLRVDVATPLNPRPGDSPVAVYVALGQAF